MPYKNPLTPEQIALKKERNRKYKLKQKLLKQKTLKKKTPKKKTPEMETPKTETPKAVAPEIVAPNIEASKMEEAHSETMRIGSSNLLRFPTSLKNHKEQIAMAKPTPLHRKSPTLFEVKKRSVPLGNLFKYIKLLPISISLLGIIGLLSFFEFQAFDSLDLGFKIALLLTVVLQVVLLGCEGFFLRYFAGETWLHAAGLGVFIVCLGALSFWTMHHDVDAKKIESIAEIENNSKYESDLEDLKLTKKGFAESYKKAFDDENFQNAREMKKALEGVKADILAHKLTKPKAKEVITASTSLENNKALILKMIRGVLFIATFIFLIMFRVQLNSIRGI